MWKKGQGSAELSWVLTPHSRMQKAASWLPEAPDGAGEPPSRGPVCEEVPAPSEIGLSKTWREGGTVRRVWSPDTPGRGSVPCFSLASRRGLAFESVSLSLKGADDRDASSGGWDSSATRAQSAFCRSRHRAWRIHWGAGPRCRVTKASWGVLGSGAALQAWFLRSWSF